MDFETLRYYVGGLLGGTGGGLVGGAGGAAAGAVTGGAAGTVVGRAGVLTGPGVIVTEGGAVTVGAVGGGLLGGGYGAWEGSKAGVQAGTQAGSDAGRWLDQHIQQMVNGEDEGKKEDEQTQACTGDCSETPSASELEGKTAEEIDEMMRKKGWEAQPTANGQGTRYANPAKPGEQIRVMPNGTSGTSRPDLHDSPYGIVSKSGARTRFNVK